MHKLIIVHRLASHCRNGEGRLLGIKTWDSARFVQKHISNEIRLYLSHHEQDHLSTGSHVGGLPTQRFG